MGTFLGTMGGVVLPNVGRKSSTSMFGTGEYSWNVVQSGAVIAPVASYDYQNHPSATGATTGDMTVSAGSSWPIAQYNPWNGINGTTGGQGGTNSWLSNGTTSEWWQVAFTNKRRFTKYGWYGDTTGYLTNMPNTWTLRGSNTGAFSGEEVILDFRSGITWSSGVQQLFTITNPNDYLYYRLVITSINGASATGLTNVKFYSSIDNAVVVTGVATVTPDNATLSASVMCQNLVINGGSLTASTNCKGLLVFASQSITLLNGGSMNMNSKGKAGNFGDLTAYSLAPTHMKSRLHKGKLSRYVVKGEGALGGAGIGGNYQCNNGLSAVDGSMKSGGGGTGLTYNGTTGKGGKGGPCCGGAGAGGANPTTSADAGDYGGPGSDGKGSGSSGGGAGDPVGALGTGSGYTSYPGEGAGGGLLLLFTPALSIASGCVISADGAKGGSGSAPGGSAGGGIVGCITKHSGYANAGTVRASGGAVAGPSAPNQGGAGGSGSTNVFQDAA